MKKNYEKAEEKTAITNSKGITLIALVVTIVVLLILAGITISAILSDGGIFSTAKRAQKIQDEAVVREKVELMLSDAQIDKYVNNKPLKDYFTQQGVEVIPNSNEDIVKIIVDGYQITIDEETLKILDMVVYVETEGVDLSHYSLKIALGTKESLNHMVYPNDATNLDVIWESANEEIATVVNGEVSGLQVGTTQITVKTLDGDFSAVCEVTVVIPVTGVTLNETQITLAEEGSATLTATVEPNDATNKNITWTSSDSTVATVTDGVVQAINKGTATITVRTEDGSYTAECTVTVTARPLASIVIVPEKNIYSEDKYGNPIVIPAGFKILQNGEQGVVYDYDKEAGVSTGEPVVQDGIVIQHEEDKNEFVWVPVGNIKNDTTGASTTNIQLGRYEDFTMNTETTPPTPPTPKQVASITAYDPEVLIRYDDYSGFFDNGTGTYNGVQLKIAGNFETIESWLRNSLYNGGYYIARYEASYGTDGKANSKPSEGTPLNSANTEKTPPSTEGQLWNYVTQEDASTASKAMYQASENLGYYSELVNSYAWDTAMIFIQAYEKVDYAGQKSLYKDKETSEYDPANTGERGSTASIGPNTTDNVCNIYDMSSNVYEWTTETYTSDATPCVFRGDAFIGDFITTSSRYEVNRANFSYCTIGFRPLLDCNSKISR